MATAHTHFVGSCVDWFTGDSPSEQEPVQRQGFWAGTQKWMEEGTGPPGRGGLERGLLNVGKVAELHGLQSLGQRAQRAAVPCGLYGLGLAIANRCRGRLAEVCKKGRR